MRMWMVDPAAMCRRHLLGEHVELHMLVGHFERKKRVAGYVARNCVEPLAIVARHKALATEMARRGWRHRSPIGRARTAHLPPAERAAIVDAMAAAKDLRARCAECRERMRQCISN